MKDKPINSRAKGAVGERELAARLREFGYEARRGQQFHGGGDSPDVVVGGLEDFHIECKRVEAGNLYTWLTQAIRDSDGTGKTPIVIHRRNRQEWVVIMRLPDFLARILMIGVRHG